VDRGRPDAWARRPLGAGGEVLELGPDEELVAGRRPVEEAFVARREARRLLVVPQRRLALEKLVLHATSLRIPVVEVEGGSLTVIAGFDGHQGIALVVAPRRWAGLDDVLALAAQREQPPLILVLDSLEDPQNVGTLLRSAEASGVHGAIFPTHRQAPLTPAAVKASAGAVEHLMLAPVDDLPGALADLHARGLRVVGADGDAALSAREADLRGPIAIVVGSEGRGLGPAVRRRCDLLVRIPMHGRIDSLNAAVAGSILLYEAAAQRGLAEVGPRPREDAEPVTPPDGDEPDASTVRPEIPAEPNPPAGTDAPSGADVLADGPAAADAPAPVPAAPRPKRASRASRKAPAAPAVDAAEDLLPGGPLAEPAPEPLTAPNAAPDEPAGDVPGEAGGERPEV
jgi:23S rRNA (guanosine2251-2'-O)-methyltransferase